MRRLAGEESALDTITVCLTCTPGHQGGPHHEDADYPLLGVVDVDIVGHLGVSTVLYCTWESCSAVEAHTTTVPWAKAPRVAGEEDCESKVQCGSASYLPVLLLAVVSSCALSLKYVLLYTVQLQPGAD